MLGASTTVAAAASLWLGATVCSESHIRIAVIVRRVSQVVSPYSEVSWLVLTCRKHHLRVTEGCGGNCHGLLSSH